MNRIKESLKRPARVAGLLPLRYLKARLSELEEDLAEALRHERMLARELDRIEADVARVAALRLASRDEDHPAS